MPAENCVTGVAARSPCLADKDIEQFTENLDWNDYGIGWQALNDIKRQCPSVLPVDALSVGKNVGVERNLHCSS